MVLRRMQIEDISKVHAIETKTSEVPWSYQIFVDCVEVGYECWVLEAGDKDKEIVGFGLLSFGAGEAHVLNVAINTAEQGKGFGKQIMEHLIAMAVARDAKSIYLEVRQTNSIALSMYENLGFLEIGKRQEYYKTKSGAKEDAIVLELAL